MHLSHNHNPTLGKDVILLLKCLNFGSVFATDDNVSTLGHADWYRLWLVPDLRDTEADLSAFEENTGTADFGAFGTSSFCPDGRLWLIVSI